MNEPRSISVSDVHLGYHKCNINAFTSFLKSQLNNPPEYFIICGDFIDLWRGYFYDIVKDNEEVFHLLRLLGDKGTKIKYILGNHDYQIRKYKKYFKDYPNFQIIEDYFILGDAIFMHGHQFDVFLSRIVFLYPLITCVYPIIYKATLKLRRTLRLI